MMDPLLHDMSVGHNTMEDGKTCSTQDWPLFDNHGIQYTSSSHWHHISDTHRWQVFYQQNFFKWESHIRKWTLFHRDSSWTPSHGHPIQSSLPNNPLVFCYTLDIILLALRETIEAAIPITEEEDAARPIGVKALELWIAIEKTQAIIM